VSDIVQYLGVFFQSNLQWDTYIQTMATWGYSTVCTLKVLRNSAQGISLPQWRVLYCSIIIPIMLYGLQVWHCPGRYSLKPLLDRLQTTQNFGCQVLTSMF
jgi:hypothetical protein